MGRWRAVPASDRDLSPQRPSAGRVMVNALGWIGRAGAPWRVRSPDFPSWEAVSQQPPRRVDGGWFNPIAIE